MKLLVQLNMCKCVCVYWIIMYNTWGFSHKCENIILDAFSMITKIHAWEVWTNSDASRFHVNTLHIFAWNVKTADMIELNDFKNIWKNGNGWCVQLGAYPHLENPTHVSSVCPLED